MNGETNGNRLNTNSYITLGLGITIIGAAVGGTFWLSTQFSTLKEGQSTLKTSQEIAQIRMEALNDKLATRITSLENAKVGDRWSGTDMFKWAVKLQRDNPSLKVSEPKHEGE